MSNFSLVHIDGELSRPATVLIEKASEAVGGVTKPWQMRRVAKAEVDAEKIRALGRIELTEMEERAAQRRIREDAMQQENIEDITRGALPHLNEDAKPEHIDQDWLAHFFDRSRIVSNEDMQSLWSKLLAGKANSPSHYSRRTIDLVSTLEHSEAHLFTRFCSQLWVLQSLMCITVKDAEKVGSYGNVSFSELTHLDSIGLITFNSMSAYKRIGFGREATAQYFGVPVRLVFPKDSGNELSTGAVKLTRSGEELALIAGAQPSPDYFKRAVEQIGRSIVSATVVEGTHLPQWYKQAVGGQ